MAADPAWTTTDASGRAVELDGSLWAEKIVRSHPEMACCREEVLAVVTRPDHEGPDPAFAARRRCYGRGVGPSEWLMVVVSYEQTPARVITAFGTRKGPRSWRA